MIFKISLIKMYLNLLTITISSDMHSYAFVTVPFCLLLLMPEIISNFDYLLLQDSFKNYYFF